jgi:hypothetical protein
MTTYRYYCNCVGWPQGDVFEDGGLSDLIDQRIQLTRRTFLQHVDREDLRELERDLSYSDHPSQGLTMAGDYHVEYFRSRLHGRRVYGFRHSAIEYVFTAPSVGLSDASRAVSPAHIQEGN